MYIIVMPNLKMKFKTMEEVINFLPCGRAILKTPSGLCITDRKGEHLGDIEISED